MTKALQITALVASLFAMAASLLTLQAVRSQPLALPQHCLGFVPKTTADTPVLVPVNLCGKPGKEA